MPKTKQSEPTGWENNPSGRPYGLQFFSGEKVDVAFGQLGPSYWYEHNSSWTRIIFTFNNAFGRIEISRSSLSRELWVYLEPNQFCIIPPNMEITLDWLRKAEVVVLFLAPSIFQGRGPVPSDIVLKDFRPLASRDRCLSQLAHLFLTACRQSDPPKRDFVEGIGVALGAGTLSQYFSPSEPSPKPRSGLPLDIVGHVTQYIDTHMGDPILARDLAGQVGLSPDHFARRFKITTDMSPKRFALKRRLEKAADLLRSGKFNVTEAAREVGFHDLSHLNRCFRNFYGYSPKTLIGTCLATDSYR